MHISSTAARHHRRESLATTRASKSSAPSPRAAQAIATALTPTPDPLWSLRDEDYEPALEHELESRFAISNGFIGVRASLERPTLASRPRALVAGFFGSPDGVPARALVPAPNWFRLDLVVDGEPVVLDQGETLSHSRTVDYRRGLLLTDWRQRILSGRMAQLRTVRFASLADRSLGAQLAQIGVDQPATARLEARAERVSETLLAEAAEANVSVWRTADSAYRIGLITDCQFFVGAESVSPRETGDGLWVWDWPARPDEPATLARLVAVGRDGSEPAKQALAALQRARRAGVDRLLAAHVGAWEQRWRDSDVTIDGDEEAQRALRFALYHLIGAANPEDERTSIGARALTGEAYLGHVFWETEIFLLPFYTLTWPEAARALLMYRYHTLPAARAKAASLGYQGALYAWESADTGDETTPAFHVRTDGKVVPVRSGTDEQHISADVGYALWQYWDATHDSSFLLNAGAEILLETARFWASRATLEADGLYHIRGVIGPDEYHEGVDDSAYTNMMARWNLERAREVVDLLRRRWPRKWATLRRKLRLKENELAQWADVAQRLALLQDPATGLVEQFAGFFQQEQVDLSAYEPREAPMDILLGPERTQRSQVIKQADVVMLLALLWERFDPEAREANFRYYEPRCGHGSSLSPPVHALVAARLGEGALATRYFRETAAIDLDDSMGNTAGGVHIGALGGLWQAAVLGFAGLGLTHDGIALDPHLPQQWEALSFPMQWRGRRLQVRIQGKPPGVQVKLTQGRPLVVRVGTLRHRLDQQRSWSCQRTPGGAGWEDVS